MHLKLMTRNSVINRAHLQQKLVAIAANIRITMSCLCNVA